MAKQERSTRVRKFAAVAMVGLMVVVITLAVGQFLTWFSSTEQITIVAPRAGLVMNPDAKVELRGVVVGRVKTIDTVDGHATLGLAIDSGQMSRIPSNINANIKSNTVFGAKAVNLEIPSSGGSGTLRSGQTIGADHVEVELNTVYQQLVAVLAKLQPDKLNATLGAIDTALSGEGDKIGVGISQLSDLLGKTNPHLNELDELLRQAAPTMKVYADSMPDLMRTVDNTVFLGDSLVAHRANLDALLVNATGMANTINGIIAPSKRTLIGELSNLAPVSRLLGYQAPGIKCFLTSTAQITDRAKTLFGGKNGNLLLDASILPGKEPYTYPESLPKVNADAPPTCGQGLGDAGTSEHAPFFVSDDAAVPYQPRTTPKANREKLFQLLFGEPKRG